MKDDAAQIIGSDVKRRELCKHIFLLDYHLVIILMRYAFGESERTRAKTVLNRLQLGVSWKQYNNSKTQTLPRTSNAVRGGEARQVAALPRFKVQATTQLVKQAQQACWAVLFPRNISRTYETVRCYQLVREEFTKNVTKHVCESRFDRAYLFDGVQCLNFPLKWTKSYAQSRCVKWKEALA